MASSKKRINLLVKEGFEHTTVGKVLSWSLSTGRVIVILTELLVILAFLSRFWLDRTLTDLNDENAIKRKQIEASSKFETDFRIKQKQLATYKRILSEQIDAAGFVSEAASLLPEGVSLTNIAVGDAGEVSLSGLALSEEGLAGFILGLQGSKKVSDVALSGLNLKTEGGQGLSFKIEAGLVGVGKEEKKQNGEEAVELIDKK